jgi:hypothetical protein
VALEREENVGPWAAAQRVVAGVADHGVGAPAAHDEVVAEPARDHVPAVVAVQPVVPGPAPDHVAPGAPRGERGDSTRHPGDPVGADREHVVAVAEEDRDRRDRARLAARDRLFEADASRPNHADRGRVLDHEALDVAAHHGSARRLVADLDRVDLARSAVEAELAGWSHLDAGGRRLRRRQRAGEQRGCDGLPWLHARRMSTSILIPITGKRAKVALRRAASAAPPRR